jgi:transposase
VEDWAEIRRLHRSEGMPIKAIARVMGCSRNTVRAALASDGPPRYVRARAGPVVDAVEPRIRELLAVYPSMPATVIAERIGWTRGLTVLKERVRELRPVYLPPDPASRTSYVAGEIAQCDLWFPPVTLPVRFGQVRRPTQLPVLTMVTGYARWPAAVLIPSRKAEDLFAGWWQLLESLGAVPRVLVWDGEGAIGRWRGGRSELTGECQAFRGTLGARAAVATGQLAVPEETCRDVLFATTDGTLWLNLVDRLGWSDQHYAAWLARLWVAQLVDPTDDWAQA